MSFRASIWFSMRRSRRCFKLKKRFSSNLQINKRIWKTPMLGPWLGPPEGWPLHATEPAAPLGGLVAPLCHYCHHGPSEDSVTLGRLRPPCLYWGEHVQNRRVEEISLVGPRGRMKENINHQLKRSLFSTTMLCKGSFQVLLEAQVLTVPVRPGQSSVCVDETHVPQQRWFARVPPWKLSNNILSWERPMKIIESNSWRNSQDKPQLRNPLLSPQQSLAARKSSRIFSFFKVRNK